MLQHQFQFLFQKAEATEKRKRKKRKEVKTKEENKGKGAEEKKRKIQNIAAVSKFSEALFFRSSRSHVVSLLPHSSTILGQCSFSLPLENTR